MGCLAILGIAWQRYLLNVLKLLLWTRFRSHHCSLSRRTAPGCSAPEKYCQMKHHCQHQMFGDRITFSRSFLMTNFTESQVSLPPISRTSSLRWTTQIKSQILYLIQKSMSTIVNTIVSCRQIVECSSWVMNWSVKTESPKAPQHLGCKLG